MAAKLKEVIMDVKRLYNSFGACILVQKGCELFTPAGKWVGCFPWNDNDAVDSAGHYIGSVFAENRFYLFEENPIGDKPGVGRKPDAICDLPEPFDLEAGGPGPALLPPGAADVD